MDGVASRVQSAIQMRQVSAVYVMRTLDLFIVLCDHVCVRRY